MLDSVNTHQPDLNANTDALLSSDYELNGTINRAASEGAKFALIMAMLEQDCTHRPHVEITKEPNQVSEIENGLNRYRSHPLSANDTYWQTCQHTSQLIHTGQLHSARLWLAMHPEPLSQYNKPDVIDNDVIANCSVNTQARIQQTKLDEAEFNVVKVDETGLYNILQALEPLSTSALNVR